jgi:hypothetical protein
MKAALVLFLAIGPRVAIATECVCPSSVEEATKYADAIFRGTITDIREKIVYFQVVRAWKGNVSKVFTMPESRESESEMNPCVGFLPDHLRVGNDLLVYANRFRSTTSNPGAYFINSCSRTNFAKDAGFDFLQLGPGNLPLELRQSHLLIWALLGVATVGAGGWLLYWRLPRQSMA